MFTFEKFSKNSEPFLYIYIHNESLKHKILFYQISPITNTHKRNNLQHPPRHHAHNIYQIIKLDPKSIIQSDLHQKTEKKRPNISYIYSRNLIANLINPPQKFKANPEGREREREGGGGISRTNFSLCATSTFSPFFLLLPLPRGEYKFRKEGRKEGERVAGSKTDGVHKIRSQPALLPSSLGRSNAILKRRCRTTGLLLLLLLLLRDFNRVMNIFRKARRNSPIRTKGEGRRISLGSLW